jgi:hypothetical protein
VNMIKKVSASLILLGLAMLLMLVPQQSASSAPPARQVAADDVPAFHNEAPEGPLPSTMSADNFTDPVVQNAYTVAARIKKVLYQQPCYCHCDRSQGHGSLLDCFASKHGAGCDTCVREDLYSYEQTRKGKTPSQIREGIIRGDWQSMDISKYQTPLPTKSK